MGSNKIWTNDDSRLYGKSSIYDNQIPGKFESI